MGYVESVAVVAMNHPDFVNVPVACLTLKSDCNSSFDTIKNNLQELCQKLLPEYSLPYDYELIDSMPYTNAGKIDFKSLESMLNNREKNKSLVLRTKY